MDEAVGEGLPPCAVKKFNRAEKRAIDYFDQGVAAWQAAAHARLNLVLSPWGVEPAAWLEQHHAIARVDLGWLPVGSLDSGRLLQQVGAALDLDAARVAAAKPPH